jgi:hypothetical protein
MLIGLCCLVPFRLAWACICPLSSLSFELGPVGYFCSPLPCEWLGVWKRILTSFPNIEPVKSDAKAIVPTAKSLEVPIIA